MEDRLVFILGVLNVVPPWREDVLVDQIQSAVEFLLRVFGFGIDIEYVLFG